MGNLYFAKVSILQIWKSGWQNLMMTAIPGFLSSFSAVHKWDSCLFLLCLINYCGDVYFILVIWKDVLGAFVYLEGLEDSLRRWGWNQLPCNTVYLWRTWQCSSLLDICMQASQIFESHGLLLRICISIGLGNEMGCFDAKADLVLFLFHRKLVISGAYNLGFYKLQLFPVVTAFCYYQLIYPFVR